MLILQIRNLLGQLILIETEGPETIRAVVEVARAKFGLTSGFRHRLFFQGKPLKDSTLVGSLQLPADQFLTFLTFQPKKGAALSASHGAGVCQGISQPVLSLGCGYSPPIQHGTPTVTANLADHDAITFKTWSAQQQAGYSGNAPQMSHMQDLPNNTSLQLPSGCTGKEQLREGSDVTAFNAPALVLGFQQNDSPVNVASCEGGDLLKGHQVEEAEAAIAPVRSADNRPGQDDPETGHISRSGGEGTAEEGNHGSWGGLAGGAEPGPDSNRDGGEAQDMDKLCATKYGKGSDEDQRILASAEVADCGPGREITVSVSMRAKRKRCEPGKNLLSECGDAEGRSGGALAKQPRRNPLRPRKGVAVDYREVNSQQASEQACTELLAGGHCSDVREMDWEAEGEKECTEKPRKQKGTKGGVSSRTTRRTSGTAGSAVKGGASVGCTSGLDGSQEGAKGGSRNEDGGSAEAALPKDRKGRKPRAIVLNRNGGGKVAGYGSEIGVSGAGELEEDAKRKEGLGDTGKAGCICGRKKQGTVLCSLPLPPSLETLERKFKCLNGFYSFLLKQHIQASWQTAREGVGHLLRDIGGWTYKDVDHMAQLCPKVVSVRDFVPAGNGSNTEPNFVIDLMDPSRPASAQLATAGLMMPSAPPGEEGYDIMPGGPRKVSQRALGLAEGRRASAFREGLAAVVQRVHADYLLHLTDAGPEKFDPIQEGRWHADFPLADFSLSTLLAEAKATAMAGDGVGRGGDSAVGVLGGAAEEKTAPARPPRQLKKVPRCTDTSELSAEEMLEHLRTSLGSLGQMVHCERLKKREARYGSLSHNLRPATWEALHKKGIRQLYAHQTQAINCAMEGRSVVVATATASGKSLCYNIPVLEALQESLDACALYLFPTKALAQDQHRALAELLEGMPSTPTIAVYDGDTCQSDRPEIRQNAQLIITNPDMLHVSILPSHSSFARILANLRYVVVDEAHAYKGAFGCHAALILRRLRRVCNHVYGSHPTFIMCSATVANPREHCQELTGVREVEAVVEDGSPCGEKLFALWNPPVVHVPARNKKLAKVRARQKINFECAHHIQAKRSSPMVEVALLLAEMVQHGLRCIAFCSTRKLCELVYTYTRETLKETAPALLNTIRAYRSGYMAKDRREIERDLFAGELRGVAATNALELGVDVGSLDATVHLGFQGTVASMWQQAGRAGRREKTSLSVYVAFESPLDQYFMNAPERLFSRPVEHAQVDSQNPEVLAQHLACAAVEHAVQADEDQEYFGAGVRTVAGELVGKGILGRHPTNGHVDKALHYIGHAKSPSQAVGIRAIDPERYSIVDERSNEMIEEVEESKAFFVVYEGAVYLHQGRTYLVKTLNLAKKEARCAQADLKYYTKTVDMTDVFVLGGSLAYHGVLAPDRYPSTTAQCSPCRVTTRWMGFRRIWQGASDSFDYVPLFLPEVTFCSQAAWIRVPRGVRPLLEAKQLEFRASLHAASHALVNVLPLYVMCSAADMGAECAHPHNSRYYPERLLIYDRHPGGIGLSLQARPMFAELLRAALELVAACSCSAEIGCPSCVQTLKCSEYNEVLNKKGAIQVLQSVIQAEDAYREGTAEPPQSEVLNVPHRHHQLGECGGGFQPSYLDKL